MRIKEQNLPEMQTATLCKRTITGFCQTSSAAKSLSLKLMFLRLILIMK